MKSAILVAVGLALAATLSPFSASLAQTGNPIVVENQRAGTAGVLTNLQSRYGPATIAGYADATSVNIGRRIAFKVSTSQPGPYRIDVFRLGYYGGSGARLLASSGTLNGITQAPCPVTDPVTRLIECQWKTSYTLNVGSDWTSGIYLAKLIHAATQRESPIYFVVRNDKRRADIVFQSARNTALAYTSWGNATEKYSLYVHNSTNGLAAKKVSFDRPSTEDQEFSALLRYEFQMLRWLESQGYDVSYISNVDVHTHPGRLLNYRVFLSAGHDEYWSLEMRNGVEAARDARVNLAFFSANTAYWRVRFEHSSDGKANRVMVCYKDRFRTPDPIAPTYRWRDPPNNRPENALMGVMTIGDHRDVYGGFDWVVANAADPLFANTGLSEGALVSRLYGYEWDAVVDNGQTPPGLVLLGASTVVPTTVTTGIPKTSTQVAHAVRYTHSSGSRVFATGSIQWMWGLDSTLIPSPRVDRRAQQFAVNVLASMGARPATPSSGIIVSQ